MRSPRVVATAGTFAALLVGAAVAGVPAAAQEPTSVFVAGCDFFEGGAVTVPAGVVDLELTGWGAAPRGVLLHWVKSQTTTLTLQFDDQAPITTDISDAWSEPMPGDERAWFSILSAPSVTLAAGESVLVTFESTWTKPTIEISFGEGHQTVMKGGGEISSTCLITAE